MSPRTRPFLYLALLSTHLLFAEAKSGELWEGIAPGPYAVGFRFRAGIDPARKLRPEDHGTALGLATWYPGKPSATGHAMTQLDYRLLSFSAKLDNASRQAFIDSEAGTMVAWRHVGIVPLTIDQARTALHSTGRAIRDTARAPGKFPVVIVLGGPWYLSTTAEVLASYGFLVVAPVRFVDTLSDIPAMQFTWDIENSLRDAEWALVELSRDPSADTANVSALGHGGGGLQALLLGMRNRSIRAVANIDSANFSTRTNPGQFVFYHPRLLRAPYLNILTSDTKSGSDLYSDFDNMRFSRRYEVVLQYADLRHNDLSDAGRMISSPLGIRGKPQPRVLRHYADVQQMLARFLDAHGRSKAREPEPLDHWLRNRGALNGYAVAINDAIEPAPATVEVLRNLGEPTPSLLAEAHHRDPDAPIFSVTEMQKVIAAAQLANRPMLAVKLARFALELHPASLPLHPLAITALESAGDRVSARELIRRCISLDLPANDWRAQAAQTSCRERAQRPE